MVQTIEFYKKAGRLFVDYNGKDLRLFEFMELPEGRKIINKMYQKIFIEYNKEIEHLVDNMNHKGEVVGAFINKFFLKKEVPFDVIILGNGNVIKFNLENYKKKDVL